MRPLVLVRGGGDLASGVVHRLHRAGFGILICELPNPLVVRRTVAFATAVLQGEIEVEGVRARLARDPEDAESIVACGEVAVLVDPSAESTRAVHPSALVDAIMAKRNTGTRITDARTVVALGPGFSAGADCHAVVETHRGHDLGRVYYLGSAAADTREPNDVAGATFARVLRAPVDGIFEGRAEIGQRVAAGNVVGLVDGEAVESQIGGILRGLMATGTPVVAGLKVGDIDPRGNPANCLTISDKARAIGGGVLEALLHFQRVPN